MLCTLTIYKGYAHQNCEVINEATTTTLNLASKESIAADYFVGLVACTLEIARTFLSPLLKYLPNCCLYHHELFAVTILAVQSGQGWAHLERDGLYHGQAPLYHEAHRAHQERQVHHWDHTDQSVVVEV